jgi:flagellar biosynthetic protein FlhB
MDGVPVSSEKHSKTEAPTPKRRKEARRKGQVARSQEISAWISLLTASVVIPTVVTRGAHSLTGLEAASAAVMMNPDEHAALHLLSRGLGTVLTVVLPLLVAMVLVGLIANVAQTRGSIATKKLKPDFAKVNPFKGFKRLFSPMSGWEGLKSLIKLSVLALLAWRSLKGLVPHLIVGGTVPVSSVLGITVNTTSSFIRTAASVGLVLALFDYLYQHQKMRKSLMMSKQEIKEEAKQSEGSPEAKGAIRRRQFKLSRLRMMAAIADADALIVNPTHVAVAMKYDTGRGAPRVVAKGADELALRLREEALRLGVPVVEEPPLARSLYRACDVGEEIPADLYEAVARVLAFLFNLRVRGRLQPLGGGALRLASSR